MKTQCDGLVAKTKERCIYMSGMKCDLCDEYFCGQHMSKHLKDIHQIASPVKAGQGAQAARSASSVQASLSRREESGDTTGSDGMKSELGQFMTTNSEEILEGFLIPEDFKGRFIEPFAGEGHLILHYELNPEDVECYDIEPKKPFIVERDTLLHPPSFKDKYLITNPPYRAKNKSGSANEEVYDRYRENDLYKCFLRIIIGDPCLGGILILPVNFLVSSDLFRDFIQVYKILGINVFEGRVFDDTSSAICSLQFEKRTDVSGESIRIVFYPSKEVVSFIPNPGNNYMLGGEIYNLRKSEKYRIYKGNSKLVVKCLDDTPVSKIRMEITEETYEIKKVSERAYLPVIIEPSINQRDEEILAEQFNAYLNQAREKYRSMFLTNYREGNRKRIEFKLVYSIVGYLLDLMDIQPLSIVCSSIQDSDWRLSNVYKGDANNSRRNFSEKYQKTQLGGILNIETNELTGTSLRFNIRTFELKDFKGTSENLADKVGKFEWTEDIDCLCEHENIKYFFNLKFITEGGGQQTRSLREVYHHIFCQIQYLERFSNGGDVFINILDGNECYKNIGSLRYVLNGLREATQSKIFIGDMKEFEAYWRSLSVRMRRQGNERPERADPEGIDPVALARGPASLDDE